MSEQTSANDVPTPVIDPTPTNVDTGTSDTTTSANLDLLNASHKDIINKGSLSQSDKDFLKDIKVSDIFDNPVNGMEIKLASRGKSVLFSIKSKKLKVKSLDKGDFTYVVLMSSAKMAAAHKLMEEQLDKLPSFDTTFINMACPEQVKGFNNKKTMENFLDYLSDASEQLTKIGDVISDNIKILISASDVAESNILYFKSNAWEWDDKNKSEISSMGKISVLCKNHIISLESQLKDVRSQIKSIKLRTTVNRDELINLVSDQLKDNFAVKTAKQAIQTNGLISAMNKAHNNTVTELINKQKLADEAKFKEFTARIKRLNDKHQKEIVDLREEHAKKTEEARILFEEKLEDQALRFAKILDESNNKHKEAVKKLHSYYEDKIEKIVEGYETTIKELHALIKSYADKLEKANKLIESYYSALDDSRKTQADMLKEFKDVASNRIEKIDTELSGKRTSNNNIADRPKDIEATTLSGDLGLKASSAAVRAKETADKAELDRIEKEKQALINRDNQTKVVAATGIAGVLSMVGYLIFKRNKSDDKTTKENNDTSSSNTNNKDN